MALNKEGLARFWAHVVSLVGSKVDKVDGKGLSTNDFTTTEKEKLAGIADSADSVAVSASLTSGTKIGSVTVNGSATDLYAPAAYSHPTTAGNKHIPSGGSSGQILRWSAAGTAVWGADNNTTYSAATTSADGLMSSADKVKLDGLPTPTTSDAGKFLRVNSAGAYELVAMANAEEATF